MNIIFYYNIYLSIVKVFLLILPIHLEVSKEIIILELEFAQTENHLKYCFAVSSHRASLNTPIHTEAWSTIQTDGSGVGVREGERPATPSGYEHPTIPTPPPPLAIGS